MEMTHKTSAQAGQEGTSQSPEQTLPMPLPLLTLRHSLSLSPHLVPHVQFPGKLTGVYRWLCTLGSLPYGPTAPLFGTAMTEDLPGGSTLSCERDCLRSLEGEMAIGMNLR